MKRSFLPRFALLSSAALLLPVALLGCSSNTATSSTPIATTAPLDAAPSETTAGETSAAEASKAQKTVTKGGSKIVWQPTFEKAQQSAKSSGKLLLVDFYTDWCGACKWMDANLYTDSTVVAEARNTVNVKVNAEKRTDLAKKYGITGFPTLVWLDGNGEVVDKLEGAPSKADVMVKIMQQARSSQATGSA